MKAVINQYLFCEFGFDTEGDESRVSESWPFVLTSVGAVGGESVFEFRWKEKDYYALGGRRLRFFPKDGYSLDDLRLERIGSGWIGGQRPVDLNTSRGEHPVIPRVPERRAAILTLGEQATKGRPFSVVEGIFLEKTRSYLALLRCTDVPEMVVCGTNLDTVWLPESTVSPPRILSLAVGRLLDEKRG